MQEVIQNAKFPSAEMKSLGDVMAALGAVPEQISTDLFGKHYLHGIFSILSDREEHEAFVYAQNPSIISELLRIIESLERKAARYDFICSNGGVPGIYAWNEHSQEYKNLSGDWDLRYKLDKLIDAAIDAKKD